MKNKCIHTLKEIANQQEDNIKKAVAVEILSDAQTDEELINFFKDLQTSGCQSGMVSSLIYCKDTHTFFDTYYDEIEELRQECKENYGIDIVIKNDLKNTLAWFAFEEVAYRLVNELEIEL
jgi:hypothetical protein